MDGSGLGDGGDCIGYGFVCVSGGAGAGKADKRNDRGRYHKQRIIGHFYLHGISGCIIISRGDVKWL